MKRLGSVLALTAALVAGGAATLRAQATDSLVPVVHDSTSAVPVYHDSVSAIPVYRDSTGVIITGPTQSVQTIGPVVDESKWPNPTTTLFKSMLVPGWGQITNKAYLKAALAIGLETWFITGAIVNSGHMNDALDKYHADPNNLDNFYEYQYYQGLRSDFLWALGVTVFVSMFDAYVDAHLRPYSEDTIPGVEPPKGLVLVFPL